MPGPAFCRGAAGCPLASVPVSRQRLDRGVQPGRGLSGPEARCPQWWQRVSAATWARSGETPVNGMSRGLVPAAAAARAAAVAVMLWMSSSAQASWRASSGLSAQRAAGAADGPLQVKERDFYLPSFGVQDRDLPGREHLVVQQGGQDPQQRGLGPAAAGAGGDGEGDEPGGGVRQPCCLRVPGARRRRVRMPSDSCSMTSSEPSGRARTVLKGTDFAPFLTRQARSAPLAENRSHRSMEKNPRSARFASRPRTWPRAGLPGRSRRRGSRRARRRSTGRWRCGRARRPAAAASRRPRACRTRLPARRSWPVPSWCRPAR